MKKKISVLLALVLVLTLLGCTKQPPEGPAINGVSLSEYAIVYSDTDTDYAFRAAQYLQERIEEITGVLLPLQEDSAVEAKYEIVVGDTEREVSQKLDTDTGKNAFAPAKCQY